MKKLKLVPFLLALAAVLLVAATASAKGGGGSCAQILSFTSVPTTTADGLPAYTTSYSVDNQCFDHENMSAVALDSLNNATGFKGREVNMLPYGVSQWGRTAPAPSGTSLTLTVTVYTPGGKVADTRTVTVVVP